MYIDHIIFTIVGCRKYWLEKYLHMIIDSWITLVYQINLVGGIPVINIKIKLSKLIGNVFLVHQPPNNIMYLLQIYTIQIIRAWNRKFFFRIRFEFRLPVIIFFDFGFEYRYWFFSISVFNGFNRYSISVSKVSFKLCKLRKQHPFYHLLYIYNYHIVSKIFSFSTTLLPIIYFLYRLSCSFVLEELMIIIRLFFP